MELFNEKGCLTDEGLQALADGTLDELGRDLAHHQAGLELELGQIDGRNAHACPLGGSGPAIGAPGCTPPGGYAP